MASRFLEKTANVNPLRVKCNKLVASILGEVEEFWIILVQEILHFGAQQLPSSQESQKLDRVDNGQRLGSHMVVALFFCQKVGLDINGKIQGTINIRQDIICPT